MGNTGTTYSQSNTTYTDGYNYGYATTNTTTYSPALQQMQARQNAQDMSRFQNEQQERKNFINEGYLKNHTLFPETQLEGYFLIPYHKKVTDIDMINTLHMGISAKMYLEKYSEINRVGDFCKSCEYKVSDQKSGFDECWLEKFPSYNPDKDHIFELWNHRKSQDFIEMGFHTLEEMESNNFPTMNDQTKAFKRQKLQIQSLKETTTAKELIDKNRKGKAILLTTHFMDEADLLGDR